MRKVILLILCTVLLLCGCSSNESESSSAVGSTAMETSTETTAAVESGQEITTAEVLTESKTETNIKRTIDTKDYQKVSELNIAEPDKNDILNKSKCIFFADGGYYYYTNIGGRASANDVLSFDSGDGNVVPIENGEDCTWRFYDGNAFYGTCYRWNEDMHGFIFSICKYENGSVSHLKEFEYKEHFSIYVFFTEESIYYSYSDENPSVKIFEMDHNGSSEYVMETGDNDTSFCIYDNKLYFCKNGRLSIYYTDSGKTETLEVETGSDGVGIGRINGDYMYYTRLNEWHDNCLMRMNLNDYKIGLVCDRVFAYDFYKDTIIYTAYDGKLFKLENDETIQIPVDYDPSLPEGYDILKIQCENERIFLEYSCGPFYSHIAEIDIDGNLINTYYDSEW